jgi:hypothetical protein
LEWRTANLILEYVSILHAHDHHEKAALQAACDADKQMAKNKIEENEWYEQKFRGVKSGIGKITQRIYVQASRLQLVRHTLCKCYKSPCHA